MVQIDPGATGRDDAIFSGERHFWCESLFQGLKSPWALFLTKRVPEVSKSVPLIGQKNIFRWRKPLCVKRGQNYPARSPRWLARKIFFWPISGTDFDTSGTRLVRKSTQGLFSPQNKLSRQKCRSPENIASSRLVAPGSPKMGTNRPIRKSEFTQCMKVE